MKALSQAEYGELRSLYESIYAPAVECNDILTEELIGEVFDELVEELIEEGYIEEDAVEIADEAVDAYIDEAKVTFGRDTAPMRKSGALVGARREGAKKAAKGAAAEAGRRAGNVAVRAKAGATRAAMKATGVSPMDVPTKTGKQRKSADTFVAGRKADRDAAKKAIKAKVKAKAGEVASKAKAKAAGAAVDVALAGSAAKRKAKETASSAKGAVKSAASGAKRGLKGLIRRGAEKVASGATKVAKRMSEEVETYDVVVEFLCDYGIAEDLQEAQWIMVNEVDSEDIATILEAYGLDEAKGTILSVKGGGKTKYTANRRDLRRDAWNAAVKSSDIRSKERGKNKANTARAEQARKKSIENMNSKELEGTSKDDYVRGTEKQPIRGLGSIRTDRAARARRASGR
jgi:hypothetical protein